MNQDNPSQIDCYTDADWAGDVATRLSTTAGLLIHGRRVVNNTESPVLCRQASQNSTRKALEQREVR